MGSDSRAGRWSAVEVAAGTLTAVAVALTAAAAIFAAVGTAGREAECRGHMLRLGAALRACTESQV